MGNELLKSEINHLERKVKILISAHKQLQDEIQAVQKENDELKDRLNQKETHLTSFQNQMKISKIVDSMVVGGSSSAELKEVIDDYIKEIDKCIAHLGEA